MVSGEIVKVEGLREFRAALKQADSANPQQLTKALKEAGSVLPSKIRGNAPHRTGKLAGSVGAVQASGTKGRVPVRAPYAAPVEFSRKGGAARGLSAKYGPPPRFAYRAVADASDEIIERLYKGMEEIVRINGWATP